MTPGNQRSHISTASVLLCYWIILGAVFGCSVLDNRAPTRGSAAWGGAKNAATSDGNGQVAVHPEPTPGGATSDGQAQWTSQQKQSEITADRQSRLNTLWEKLRANWAGYLDASKTPPAKFNPVFLYNLQMDTNLFFDLAVAQGDLTKLDQLASLLLPAKDMLIPMNTYQVSNGSGGFNTVQLDTTYNMWLDSSGRESILNSAQFLFLATHAVNEFLTIPEAKRTQSMTNFITGFGEVSWQHYNRWIFKLGVFQVIGWNCTVKGARNLNFYNHQALMVAKQDGSIGDTPSYCKAITDLELWIVAGAAELLSAGARDSSAVPYPSTQSDRDNLRKYVQSSSALIRQRVTNPMVTTSTGDQVSGFLFDAGVWTDHTEWAWSNFEGDLFPIDDSINPLMNGDFETTDIGRVPSWTLSVPSGTSTFDSQIKHTGKYSLKLISPGIRTDYSIWQSTSVTAGDSGHRHAYRASAWVKMKTTQDQFQMQLVWSDANGKTIPASTQSTPWQSGTTAGDWTWVTLTGQIPLGATQVKLVMFVNGTAWIDDGRFLDQTAPKLALAHASILVPKAVSPTTSYDISHARRFIQVFDALARSTSAFAKEGLIDGDFETSDSVGKRWTLSDTGAAKIIADAWHGSDSVQLVPSANGSYLRQDVPVVAGQEFDSFVRLKIMPGGQQSSQSNLQVAWLDSHGNSVAADLARTSSNGNPTKSGWQMLWLRGVVPANAAYARVTLYASTTVLFDDAHYVLVDTSIQHALANQFAFRIFRGDLQNPTFNNFFDGSNGWFRVGYVSTAGFGYAPSQFSSAAWAGGFCAWRKYQPYLTTICDAMWARIEQSNAPWTYDYSSFEPQSNNPFPDPSSTAPASNLYFSFIASYYLGGQ